MGSHIMLTNNYIEKTGIWLWVFIEDAFTRDIEGRGDSHTTANRRDGMYRKEEISTAVSQAVKLVEEIMSKGRISFDMLDLRSYGTYAHSMNVGVLCGVIGMEMHMDEKKLAQLVMAALCMTSGNYPFPMKF